MAVSFVTAATAAHFRIIEKKNRLAIEREQVAGFEPTEMPPVVRDVNGGIKGSRKSKKDKLREEAARVAGSVAVPAPVKNTSEPMFPFSPSRRFDGK